MNEEAFNTSLRQFLKLGGITSQRKIEMSVREALGDGRLTGSESLSVKLVLTLENVDLAHTIDGTIKLQ